MTLDHQIEIFKTLGYIFHPSVTKDILLSNVHDYDNPEDYFTTRPFEALYFFYGWRGGHPFTNYSNNCIWYDLEFIDSSGSYEWFMKRMGVITKGELEFDNINITADKKGYEWIEFTVNGKDKKWQLEKVGFISDSFFYRFSELPQEFKTKGRYTYYDNGGQQFLIDYATPAAQDQFITVTGIQREWLDEGHHFSRPKPSKKKRLFGRFGF